MRCGRVVRKIAQLFGQQPSQTEFRLVDLLDPTCKSFRQLLVTACLPFVLAESVSAHARLIFSPSQRRAQSSNVRDARLVVGRIIEKSLVSGEQHDYWLTLAPGQFMAVQLE